jgi:hypothetical protein
MRLGFGCCRFECFGVDIIKSLLHFNRASMGFAINAIIKQTKKKRPKVGKWKTIFILLYLLF